MELVIERGELLRALGHVTSVVERRTTSPILSNVLLTASGQTLHLKATDLEREFVEGVPAQVRQSGAMTVSAHVLHEIVRKLPDGAEVEITRDAEKERVSLTAGHSRFELQTLSAEEFPDMAAGELSHRFEIGASDLRRLIDKTRFAISAEEASTCISHSPTERRYCGQSQPTAIALRRSNSNYPGAQPVCQA
jgi:DNA polymerase III subunit beta